MLSLNLAASSKAKTLFSTGISFHFWHVVVFKDGKYRLFIGFNKRNLKIKLSLEVQTKTPELFSNNRVSKFIA